MTFPSTRTSGNMWFFPIPIEMCLGFSNHDLWVVLIRKQNRIQTSYEGVGYLGTYCSFPRSKHMGQDPVLPLRWVQFNCHSFQAKAVTLKGVTCGGAQLTCSLTGDPCCVFRGRSSCTLQSRWACQCFNGQLQPILPRRHTALPYSQWRASVQANTCCCDPAWFWWLGGERACLDSGPM